MADTHIVRRDCRVGNSYFAIEFDSLSDNLQLRISDYTNAATLIVVSCCDVSIEQLRDLGVAIIQSTVKNDN